MRLRIQHHRAGHRARRGSALLMAFLMLVLLFAIVFQLSYSTNADLRVANNDVMTTSMDLAIESALQEVYDRLKTDAEASGDSGEGGDAGGAGGAQTPAPQTGSGAAGGQQQAQPTDSHEDDWAKPQRTTINEIEMRIVIQDEDSKLNVLGMLTADEEQADKQFERVVRVIDLCRAGSSVDIDHADAIRIAEEIREYLRQRTHGVLPKPKLLSDDEENPDRGLAQSFNEFGALEHLGPELFCDFRDDRGYIVHSLGSYLTVWSSITSRKDQVPTTGGGGAAGGSPTSNQNGASGGSGNKGGSGSQATSGGNNSSKGGSASQSGGNSGGSSQTTGGGNNASGGNSGGSGGGGGGSGGSVNFGAVVNVNTAPLAVLNSLADDRVIPGRFWDGVLEWRNLEDQDAKAQEDPQAEPVLDEYGNEVIKRQVFDSLDKLSEVDGYDRLDTEAKAILESMLTTQSQVFSIYVTARKATGQSDEFGGYLGKSRDDVKEDQRGQSLVRTVRSIVWRYKDGDNVRIIPIVRWDVVDYTPFELQDYPNEDR